MKSLHSKTILITGAGSGIGKDVAFELARLGHQVIATTETEEQSAALLSEASQMNATLDSFRLDITDEKDRSIVSGYDAIDVLINNAAVGECGPLAEIDMNVVRRNFEVNVFAAFELTQSVLASMITRKTGMVIFVSSTAGRVVVPFLGPYCMTKFSLSSGVESLRKEIRSLHKDIHVSLVEPGAYHTGFNQRMIESQFLRMDEKSFYYQVRNKIRNRLEYFFRLIEVRSTRSIVKTIVRVVDARNPRLRYTAPWWQAVGVWILRIVGK